MHLDQEDNVQNAAVVLTIWQEINIHQPCAQSTSRGMNNNLGAVQGWLQ